ncbi:hypothetical protein ACFX16_046829 [Malus domestica]
MKAFSEVVASNSVGNFKVAISYTVPLSNPRLSDDSRGLSSLDSKLVQPKASSSPTSHCEFSSLNSPFDPRT